MSNLPVCLRPLARRLTPVLGLLLACGIVAAGLHQHHDTLTHRTCVACVSAHTPAVSAMASIAPAGPAIRCFERLRASKTTRRPQIARATASSRAPPSA